MSNSALKEWTTDELVNFCDVVGGGTPDRSVNEYWGGQVPWASPTEITSRTSKYISNTKEGITQLGLEKSSAKLHPVGTVLMTSRASIGYVAINTVPMATNQGFQSLRCKDGTLADYMYQYITWIRPELERMSAGSTFSEISSANVKRLRVTLPPLPEQQKIATILSSVDDVIEKTRAQIDKLKDLKTGMMQELLTKGIGHTEFKDSPMGRIPAAWDFCELDKYVKLIPGYAFSSTDFTSEGAPLVRMGNLYQNQLDLSRSPRYLPKNYIQKHEKFCVYPNDIVLSMTGTGGKEDYGFAVRIPQDTPVSLLNQRVVKVVAGQKVHVNFLLHLLHSRFFLNEIYSVAAGTKQANLSSANILSVELPFPPMEEQRVISGALDSVSERINKLYKANAGLKNIKKALMQDLLTGKVRVKLTDKESAVV